MHKLFESLILITVSYFIDKSCLRPFKFTDWLALHQNAGRTLTELASLGAIGQIGITWTIQLEDREANTEGTLCLLSFGLDLSSWTLDLLFILFLSSCSSSLWRAFLFNDKDELSDGVQIHILVLAIEKHKFVDCIVDRFKCS